MVVSESTQRPKLAPSTFQVQISRSGAARRVAAVACEGRAPPPLAVEAPAFGGGGSRGMRMCLCGGEGGVVDRSGEEVAEGAWWVREQS